MNLVIFLLNFDGFLSEFHGYSQKFKINLMMKCLEILIKSAPKSRKKAENSEICAKFYSFISFFSITSLAPTVQFAPDKADELLAPLARRPEKHFAILQCSLWCEAFAPQISFRNEQQPRTARAGPEVLHPRCAPSQMLGAEENATAPPPPESMVKARSTPPLTFAASSSQKVNRLQKRSCTQIGIDR